MTVVMTPVAGKPGINASRRPLTLVPVFPAGLTLIAPVDLATVTPAMRAMPARDVPQFQKILVRV